MNTKKIASEIEIQNKSLTGNLIKSYTLDGLEYFTFCISSEILDRDDEIINIDGINIDNFVKNPVCFYNHWGYDLPIGTWKNIKKGTDNKYYADLVFHELPNEHDKNLSETVKKYVSLGILNAVSIGFISHKNYKITVESATVTLPNKRSITIPDEKLNRIMQKGILYHESIELLEISVVNIPANADALAVKNLKKGNITESEYELMKQTADNNIKSGKVLSAENKAKLEKALELITEVIATATDTADADDDATKTANEKIINNVLSDIQSLVRNISDKLEMQDVEISEMKNILYPVYEYYKELNIEKDKPADSDATKQTETQESDESESITIEKLKELIKL